MEELFAASGQLGRDLLLVDWEATPLGLPSTWPQSLKTVIRVLLSSRFSMWMAWGHDLTMFFNETYRRDTLGSKYPWALGRSAREVWAEIWGDIGPRIETVMTTGVASWDESLLLFLERNGYREETYHTFSYSPLTDDDSEIVGMLCVVSEETERVVGDRRMAILRDLGSELTAARSEDEVYEAAAAQLGVDLRTIPFSLIYLFEGTDTDDLRARLVSAAGVIPGDPAAPRVVDVGASWSWHIDAPSLGETELFDMSPVDAPRLPTGDWDDPPSHVLKVPLLAPTNERPYGFLIAGLDPFRPFDSQYQGFLSLIASQIAASIAKARAFEEERQRAETLAALDRVKTTFFTNVSHEFRTPLTLLLGPAEDALADSSNELAPDQRDRVELVLRNGHRLLKLVNTLLDFSRLEAGRVTPHFEPVELASYTEQLVSMFRGATERAGIGLAIEADRIPETVFIDREMWAKIVSNLLSNALKFTFTGGITVRLTYVEVDESATVRLEVEDTGIGIAPPDQANLFERFHRVAGARSRTYEGSGIGLALVSELAHLHGGSAAAHSIPGTGSTFVVDIPMGYAHLDSDYLQIEPGNEVLSPECLTSGFVDEAMRWLESPAEGAKDRTGDPDSPRGSDQRPRVLVVDDNADMRRYIRSLLDEAYDVEVAADGAVALEMARAAIPDLVLTDVMMPNLDGFGLLAALRADPSTSSVPVVMLSARAGEDAAVGGLDAGADDYLIKPFSALELVARVRSNLELECARRDSARREHAIAEDLQRSLMPDREFRTDDLDVATYYQPGVRGTQVGGDWYDVIDLRGGRTALVIGDVMGRGVRAAAIMGQVRSAVRAYARLDLPPANVLELMDAVVRDFSGGQLVTCIYAVYDAADNVLSFSNCGHLPPLLVEPDAPARRLTGALGPPLGVGPAPLTEERIHVSDGSVIVLYTDGLVERRDADIDSRIDLVARKLDDIDCTKSPVTAITTTLAAYLCPDGSEDDVAMLVARASLDDVVWPPVTMDVSSGPDAVASARYFVRDRLEAWDLPPQTVDDVVLIASELVTNALIHGRPPATVRLRRTQDDVRIEVTDAGGFLPRRLRPTPQEEHGRGLQIVEALADSWGSRVTESGKSLWCIVIIRGAAER